MDYRPNDHRYEGMTFRRAGHSGLDLPTLSLGLWQNFGQHADPSTVEKLCTIAFDRGVVHFDLANNYGPPPGSAERIFGRILNTQFQSHRDELVVSTKAGYGMWPGPYGDGGSRKYLLSSLDQSLQRLGIDYVDIFYSHRFDPSTPLEETMGALASAVHQGKALYIGISNYPLTETQRSLSLLSDAGVPCLVHQPRYSLFDRAAEKDGLLDALHHAGVGAVVYSPLAQGLLTNRYLDTLPRDSRALSGEFLSADDLTETRLKQIRALHELAAARGQSLAQMALTWVWRHPRVTSAIIGASRPEQLIDCLGAINAVALCDDELAHIDAACAD
ncbi:MAG: aldo/keto reductase [Pseudomonadota bacterium]